jgi:hypothetical protein
MRFKMSEFRSIALHEASHAVIARRVIHVSTRIDVLIRPDGSGLTSIEGSDRWSLAQQVAFVAAAGIVDRIVGNEHCRHDRGDDEITLNRLRTQFTDEAWASLMRMVETQVLAHRDEILKTAAFIERNSPATFRWSSTVTLH